ncbi:hypothetical protein BC937DRAFT_94667 [Endogone sp. FLAS-F59071]|nr:hypothetical protein BC937DRAFT_94667 [Endogone sp. FLAS-F59071]|eukprot:RUS13864.1 hypothetical protein BC937DRAFT_94667 [Endogone sp. FLAS-F59071]
MFSDAADLFRGNGRFEPRWFKSLRLIIAICSFIGIFIYLTLLLIIMDRKETYFTSTQVNRNSTNYNPFLPIPNFSISYSTDMSSWMPPYLDMGCTFEYALKNASFSEHTDLGCTSLNLQPMSDQTIFYESLLAPLYFADSVSCNQHSYPPPSNCDGLYSFSMSVRLLPNITISPYAVVKLSVNSGSEDSSNLDLSYVPLMYNIIPGQSLWLYFDYTENHDIAGNVYYTYTVTETITILPLNSTEILNTRVVGFQFQANSAYYTITYERYYHTWGELFGLIGGLYGGVTSVFMLLFGSIKFSPWGLLQKIIFRMKLSGALRDGLSESDSLVNSGTPFTDPIPTSDVGNLVEDVVILRERMEKLELFLSNYVIDKGLLGSGAKREPSAERKDSVLDKTLVEG